MCDDNPIQMSVFKKILTKTLNLMMTPHFSDGELGIISMRILGEHYVIVFAETNCGIFH